MKRPLCLYCGKPIPKHMEYLNLRSREQAERGLGGRDWLTVEQLPQTKEEAQTLTNWTVTRVDKFPSGGGISTIYGWDGESYAPRHGHFCKIDCAARFGRAMADRGARL